MPSKTKRVASPDPEEEEETKTGVDEDETVKLPDLDNPYATLEVAEDATADQIKKAYRKLSLKHHPDKASSENKEEATAAFQKLTAAYALLSDERRRKRYDATGDASETLLDDDDFNWSDFFKEQFKETVTEDKITSFAKRYRGSDEERTDVLQAFQHPQVQGDMGLLFQRVILSNMLEDEDRFRAMIDKAIEDKEVEAYPAYTQESASKRDKRMKKARKEADEEAKEAAAAVDLDKAQARNKKKASARNKGDNDLDSLAALIQNKNKGRSEHFLADLEAKYGGNKKKKSTKRSRDEEPTEEEFAAIQAKLGRRRK